MDFNATSTNMTELLVMTLVLVAAIMMMKKRYDSNLPLLSYVAIFAFNSATDRPGLSPFLLYGGLGLALIVRFEFMGSGFAKFISYMAIGSMCVIIWLMVGDVFSV
jgi:hypothetical protein